jgi:hypothetical protein
MRALEYREAFLETVTPEEVRAIGAALLERAKAGDPIAARLVLDRILGSAAVADWEPRDAVEHAEFMDAF